MNVPNGEASRLEDMMLDDRRVVSLFKVRVRVMGSIVDPMDDAASAN